MSTTQIVRQIDETGRLVLPKPFREMLGINLRDKVLLSISDGAIVLRKYADSCVFCGHKNTLVYRGTPICKDCVKKIGRIKE